MRQLLEAGPQQFFEEALPILRTDAENHGVQYLVTLLLINDLILQALSDPQLFSLPEATHLAQILLRVEPLLDIKMARALIDVADPNSKRELEERAASERGTRVLEILSAISDGARILPVMAQLLHHPNVWVRSKAALMVGRSNKNHKWVSQQLEETDGRVRANAIESLWGVESEGSQSVFWSAVSDPDNRVVGNALIALYRLGKAGSIPLIIDLLKHPSTDFRVTGIWVMGESGDQRFSGLLARYLSDPIATVRSAAFRSIAKLKRESAKFNSAAIDVRVCDFGYSAGRVRVSVAAWAPGPESGQAMPVSGLKATQFVLYENSEVISDYEVEEISHTELNAIAFALPRVGDTDSSFHQACVSGIRAALRHKRKSEGWMVLKYLPEKEREAPVRTAGTGILRLDEIPDQPAREAWPLPPEARFSADPAVIEAAAIAMGTRLSVPPSLPQAVKSLLPAVAHSRGSRHLVVVNHPLIGDLGAAAWKDFALQARAAKVAVHSISIQECPGLRALSQQTGAAHFAVPDASKIPETLEALCAKLAGEYSIRYRPTRFDSAPGTLRVQIFSQHGLGEQTCPHSPQPQLEAALAS